MALSIEVHMRKSSSDLCSSISTGAATCDRRLPSMVTAQHMKIS